jgi:hypothetical protein
MALMWWCKWIKEKEEYISNWFLGALVCMKMLAHEQFGVGYALSLVVQAECS